MAEKVPVARESGFRCAFVVRPELNGRPVRYCNEPADVERVGKARLSLCAKHDAALGRDGTVVLP